MGKLFPLSLILLTFLISCSKKENTKVFREDAKPAELLALGDQYYNAGDYESAFLAYGVVYNNYPTSREYIDGAIGLSRCYGALKDYEKEFEILLNLLRENLIPSKVPKIYNAIAEFYERSAGISAELTGESSGDFEKAIQYLEKAIKYPNSQDKQAKGYAQYKIGTLYEQMRNYAKAIEAYQNTINGYGDTEWAPMAEARIGKIREKVSQILPAPSPAPEADTTRAAASPSEQKMVPQTQKADTLQPQAPAVVPPDTTVQDTSELQEQEPPRQLNWFN